LSFIILKTAITKNQILGIVLSTLGVIFIVLQGNLSKISTFSLNGGDVFILFATLSWALYSVLLKYKPLNLTAMQFFTTMVVIGFILLLPFYLFSTQSIAADLIVVQKHYDIVIFMVIFPSILSFLFWNKGILEIGADKTGQFTHLMPVFGTALAYIFLDEILQTYHFLGMGLIFSGIYLSLFLSHKTMSKK
jgi:drug/metabolite transporter (DMT)-like permease